MAVDPLAPTMALWSSVEATDPKFVKPITGKAYQGSSPNPHWLRMRMTEKFGPAGIGWGVKVREQHFITSGHSVAHYLTIELWYMLDGQPGTVEAMGGTVIAGVRKSGDSFIDEDGPKKSMTDAFVKACAELGFCADIFLGRWDDSKYVEQRREEEKAAGAAVAAKTVAQRTGELAARATTIIAYLEAAESQQAYTAARADALALRTELMAAKMSDIEAKLGEAVKAAASRFTRKEAAA